METFGLITLYSIMMMVGLSIVAAVFSLLAMWLSDQANEGDAPH